MLFEMLSLARAGFAEPPFKNGNIREYFTLASKILQNRDMNFPPWSGWAAVELGREVVSGRRRKAAKWG